MWFIHYGDFDQNTIIHLPPISVLAIYLYIQNEYTCISPADQPTPVASAFSASSASPSPFPFPSISSAL